MRPFAQLALIAAIGTAGPARAQYDGPESVEYDAAGDRYFISNTGDGTIKQRDQAGNVTPFASVSPAPYGLEIQGDTLFACSGGGVKGYLLSTGAQVFDLGLGGTFCNGITSDGTFLYVTDFSEEKIYRVDVAANSFSTWVADTDGTPNGIVFDPAGDRLAVAFWGTNAAVKTYDRATAAPGAAMNTGLANIDGITIDCTGLFLLASWSPDKITRIISFTDPLQDVITTGLNNPADIDFDPVRGEVCVPNSSNDQVIIEAVAPCATAVGDGTRSTPMRATPNPTTGLVWIDLQEHRAVPYLLLDARGLLIGGGTLPVGGLLDLGGLAPGRYTLDFPGLRRHAQLVKE